MKKIIIGLFTLLGILILIPHNTYAARIDELARLHADEEAWEGTKYHPMRPNLKDRVVGLAEDIGYVF